MRKLPWILSARVYFHFFYPNLTQEETKRRLRLMSRRRRRRHKSFEIEMSYESLQLQTLQFCVMGYDEYSRNKVIGDVLLPLAELARQGLDITRELVMWRDIQTCQPVNNSLFLYRECFCFLCWMFWSEEEKWCLSLTNCTMDLFWATKDWPSLPRNRFRNSQ